MMISLATTYVLSLLNQVT